jgi:hypothetical protein
MPTDHAKPEVTPLIWLLRIAGGLVMIALIVATVLFGYVLYLQRIHQADFEAQVQFIRDSGEPLTAAELTQLAAIPVGETDITGEYQRALGPLLDGQPLSRSLAKLTPFCTLHKPGLEPPHRPSEWDQLAAAEAELIPYQSLLKDLERAGGLSGAVSYPVNNAAGMDATAPYQQACLKALRPLEAQAVSDYHRGHFSRATDQVIALVRLAETMRHDPLVSSQLSRMTMLRHARQLGRFLAWDLEFPVAELKRLQVAFEPVDFLAVLLPMTLNERGNTYLTITQPLQAELASQWKLPQGVIASKARPGDCAALLRWQSRAVGLAKLPFIEAIYSVKALDQDFQSEQMARNRKPDWMQFRICDSNYMPAENLASWVLRAETDNRVFIAFCALEQFRRANNRVPLVLDDLVPEFLTAVPLDPCNNRQLIFRRTRNNHLLIYGLGIDAIDNGGEIYREGSLPDDYGIESFQRVKLPQ